LNETKIDETALDKDGVRKALEEWFPLDLQFWNCAVKKGYAGTAILISRDLASDR